MSPSFFSRVASQQFRWRWWYLGISVVGAALVFAAFAYGSTMVVAIAGTLAGPLIFVPWALLCTCVWFHPERGNLQSGSRFIGKLPLPLQAGVRWYAAFVLALFFVVGVLVWPALSLAWL